MLDIDNVLEKGHDNSGCHWLLVQNQSPQLKHADLILNLMRCIGAAATAEDGKEEENQKSPAMLKKHRKYLLDPSGEEDKDLQAQISGDKLAASGDRVASPKKEGGDAEMNWPVDAELFGVAEIAEMATLLLHMILELCGGSAILVRHMRALEVDHCSVLPCLGLQTCQPGMLEQRSQSNCWCDTAP